jgi:hypothetical protein
MLFLVPFICSKSLRQSVCNNVNKYRISSINETGKEYQMYRINCNNKPSEIEVSKSIYSLIIKVLLMLQCWEGVYTRNYLEP